MELNKRLIRLEKQISALVRYQPREWQRKCKRITRIITRLIEEKGRGK